MRLWILGALLLQLAVVAHAEAGIVTIAKRYIAAQQAVMEKNASEKEVEALIKFYAPDYTYYHPQAGAKVTGLETIRKGISSHLGETAAAKIEVRGVLANGDAVALALRESFVDLASGKRIERDRMTVLTIRKGKLVQRVDM